MDGSVAHGGLPLASDQTNAPRGYAYVIVDDMGSIELRPHARAPLAVMDPNRITSVSAPRVFFGTIARARAPSNR